jgi:dephospho-CoA kinase
MAKRGVKSYPCLIPSMQKLTERGILLANRFRKLGFAVIESYPGAAQDILGIPRKKKSMEYLIKGLHSFGIKGTYERPEVSHDEIDAITSAIVGYFYLADQYEALGNENEDYLIIPELKSVEKLEINKSITIGLSGELSSGKTTSGELLVKLGFSYGRYSMVIASLLKNQNNEVNRLTMQAMGENVNKHKGQRWLGNELLKLLPNNKKLVIDGLRFLEDHSFLRERFKTDFYHIHLIADEEIRKERYYKKEINNTSFEEANEHLVENEVKKLQNFADIILPNIGSISNLEIELTQIINKLCQSQ